MGQHTSHPIPSLISAKQMQDILLHSSLTSRYLILSVLPDPILSNEPVIPQTLSPDKEEEILNQLLESGGQENTTLIVYGKNNADTRVFEKYYQLHHRFGFQCSLYLGGMFEWLLLQKIHGEDAYPTQIVSATSTQVGGGKEKWEKWG